MESEAYRRLEGQVVLHLEETTEHRRAIASMRNRMNSMLPISRLPSEVLLRIFTFYVEAMKLIRTSYRDTGHYTWMDITYVCHSWRVYYLCPS